MPGTFSQGFLGAPLGRNRSGSPLAGLGDAFYGSNVVNQSCLILSDTHLSPQHGRAAATDLASLLNTNPDLEVILAGDVFDLSLDSPELPVDESAERAITAHPDLWHALKSRAQRGSKLTLVPGNHDAGLAAQESIDTLKRLLEVPDDRQLEVAPWFVRRGDVHIEHGHLYDPDCAPNHPLADPNPHAEGLGTALMRRFIAPNHALMFAHAHTTTPLAGLKKAFEVWGPWAPLVVARYFQTAFALCGESVFRQRVMVAEREAGNRRLADHAQRVGVEQQALATLLETLPSPTHQSLRDTFLRLYFDRIFAGVALATGASLLTAAGLSAALPSLAGQGLATSGTGSLLTAVGGGYLAYSLRQHGQRNHWTVPVDHLNRAARLVNETTGSRLAVFGHTHVEVETPGYLNLGSFGFASDSRPYAIVQPDGRHERCSLPASAG